MSSHGNIHDFLSKIDWEGGVYEALQYGLKVSDYDLPQEVVDSWNEIRESFADLDELVTEFNKIADRVADQTPYEEE